MSNKEQLLNKIRSLLPEKVGEDLTITVDGELIFLTHVFENGSVLGFWSHSPWGRVSDGEQGWMIISKELEQLGAITSKTNHERSGEDIRKWKSSLRLHHGKSFKLKPEWNNESFWKITEC